VLIILGIKIDMRNRIGNVPLVGTGNFVYILIKFHIL